MKPRVLIADDQAIVRSGLRLVLEAQDIDVIAEATNGREAVDLARQTRPDVAMVDIRMPVLDGLEVTRQLAGPHVDDPIPVVIVTTFDLDEYVHTAIRNGATGFLLKDAGPALLAGAVHAAINGDALVSPSITVRLLEHFATANQPTQAPEPSGLSEREEAVATAVARGLTNKEISRDLHISLSTVKSHLAHIQTKLAVRNRVEIAGWAWQTGHMHR